MGSEISAEELKEEEEEAKEEPPKAAESRHKTVFLSPEEAAEPSKVGWFKSQCSRNPDLFPAAISISNSYWGPRIHFGSSQVQLGEPEDHPPGLILPNGEINWNCPCLGGMAIGARLRAILNFLKKISGPCGIEFREAFSCFHYSEVFEKIVAI